MKVKNSGLMFVVMAMFVLLVGCGKQITQDDLMKNKWEVADTNDKDQEIIAYATFSKTSMTLSFDSNDNGTTASEEAEELGKELGKQLIASMTYDIEYTLNEGVIHLKNKDLDLDSDFNVRKDDKKIVFTNEDTKAEMVLTPVEEK